MIPRDQEQVLDAGLRVLEGYGQENHVRGRFVAMYLGLRRMGSAIAALGSDRSTPAGNIERFLDDMFTKTHRPDPFVVLTAPFGGSASRSAPYSSRSGVTAPGHRSATNTWRNNRGIQKGIGCPAEPATIESLLHKPEVRSACPHMRQEPGNRYVCTLTSKNTEYRGEKHSIWLRSTGKGYQVVDLDLRYVYETYLTPDNGARIPIFGLIAVLYTFAPSHMYPPREAIGIPDFAEDFRFSLQQVASLFDTDPESEGNAVVLQAARVEMARMSMPPPPPPAPPRPPATPPDTRRSAGDLPLEADPIAMNTGIGAERLVAQQLTDCGWQVMYRGNQVRVGYDLEATHADQVLHVEVKSSVGFANPQLTESEWTAAKQHGEQYVLAVVDFYGSDHQRIWYVRNPAAKAAATTRSISIFTLARASIEPLGTAAELL